MCGIAGYFNSFNYDNQECFELSNLIQKTINTRGPDYNGYWNNSYLFLIHSRLSIIDTSINANQPMISPSGRYILIFNGEIYNYSSLKNKYLKDFQFKSNGDTEVIIQLFDQFGIDKTIKLLNGMFAISVYDNLEKQLFLIRDRVGQKPIYYYYDKKNFFFSSDLSSFQLFKRIKLKLNYDVFNEYLNLGYFPQRSSPYKNIYKVLPGSIIKIKKIDNSFKVIEENWIKNKNKKDFIRSNDEVSDLNKIFLNVLEDNLIADVNKGVFLSSGVDSTIIASYSNVLLKKKLNTFTIGFANSNYDESLDAEKISKKIKSNHHNLILNHHNIKDAILNMENVYSEPFGDTSQIPTYLLSKFSSKKIKVALSGDGGDELFGGYNRYQYLQYLKTIKYYKIDKILNLNFFLNTNLVKKIFINKYQNSEDKIFKLKNLLNSKCSNDYELYKLILSNNNFSNQNSLLINEYNSVSQNYNDEVWSSNLSFREKMMKSDFLNYLPDDILVKTDRASMYSSLEVRAPFLDDRIIDFSNQLKLKNKVNNFNKKIILHKILSRYFNIKINPNKKGFAIPLNDYLTGDLSYLISQHLNIDKIKSQKIFNVNLIQDILIKSKNMQQDYSKIIWNLISLQKFIDKHEKNYN